MINHHPADDLLLALAAGRLPPGPALLLGVHLEGCADCRQRLHLLHALGGALIEDGEPLALAPEAWARTLQRIDAGGPPPAPRPALAGPGIQGVAALQPPGGLRWPQALRDCRSSRWRWMGPGMHFARLTLAADPQARLFLLRIAPGRSLARHSHEGLELTQVLCGRFDDGRSGFGPGDFDATDETVLHQPVVQPGGECVCLAYVERRLRFEGRVAAWIGGRVGM
jgi:putative transcriptional regulator